MFTMFFKIFKPPLLSLLLIGLLGCSSGFKTSVETHQAGEHNEIIKDRFTISDFDSQQPASFEFPNGLGTISLEANSFERPISLGLNSEVFGRVVRLEVQSFFIDNGLMTKEELKKGLSLSVPLLSNTQLESIQIDVSLDYGKSYQNFPFSSDQIVTVGSQKKLRIVVNEPNFIIRAKFPEISVPSSTGNNGNPQDGGDLDSNQTKDTSINETTDPTHIVSDNISDSSVSEDSENNEKASEEPFTVTLEFDSITVNEDQTFSSQIYAMQSNPQVAQAFLVNYPKFGEVTFEEKVLSYTPNSDFNGSDSLTLLFLSKEGLNLEKELNITVHPINDAPSDKTVEISTSENQIVNFEIDTIDIDSTNLIYEIKTTPQKGTVFLTQTASKAIGSFTPTSNLNGVDSFTIGAIDQEGGQGTITVDVDIAEVNTPPTLSVINVSKGNPPTNSSDAYYLVPGQTFSITVSVTDIDSNLAKISSCKIDTKALNVNHKNYIAEASAVDCDGLLSKASESELYPSATSMITGLNTKNATFVWTPHIGQDGIYDLQIQASDEVSSDTLIFRLYVGEHPLELTQLTGSVSSFANQLDSSNPTKNWLESSTLVQARSIKGLNNPNFSLVPSTWTGDFIAGDGSLLNPIGIFSTNINNSLEPSTIDTAANIYGFHLKVDGLENNNHGKVVFENAGASNPITVKRIGASEHVTYQIATKGTKTYAEYTMDLNPELYLRFEEPTKNFYFRDLSSNQYYGVTRLDIGNSTVLPRTGATTLSRLSQGSHSTFGLGKFLQLNGDSESTFLEIPYGQLQPPFTIELFFKPEVFNWDTILGKPKLGSSTGAFYLQYSNSNTGGRTADRLNFCINDTTNTTICSVSDDGVAKTIGTWYHGVFVHDGSEMRMYIDGVLQANTRTATSPLANQSGYFFSGEWYNNAPNQIFQGAIDELAIYSRALTPTEISDHLALASNNQYCMQTASNSAGIHDLFISLNPTSTSLSVASETSCTLNLASQVEESSVSILNNQTKDAGFLGKLIHYSQFEADSTNAESIPGYDFISDLRLNSLLSKRTLANQVVLNKYRPVLNLNAEKAGFQWKTPEDEACNFHGLSFWDDYFAGGHAAMMGFDDTCSVDSGWHGLGIDADPYRVKLDGSDDEIFYTLDDSQFNENISIGVWFKLDSLTSWARLFSIGSGKLDEINFVPQHGDAPLRPSVRFISSSLNRIERLNTTFVTDQWYHVLFVMNHIEDKVYVYLNGEEDISFIRPSTYRLSQIDIEYARIGGSYWDGDPFYDGAVSSFIVLDEALTPAEAKALCVATKPISTLNCNE